VILGTLAAHEQSGRERYEWMLTQMGTGNCQGNSAALCNS